MTFGFAFKSAQFTNDPADLRLLRGDNVAPRRLRWAGVRRWPRATREEYAQYELRQGDVVIAMDRPWIEAGLKYSVVRSSDLPALLVQRVARLRVRGPMDQGYLGYLIGSDPFTAYVRAVQTGSAVPHISGGQIADFRFPQLPSVRDQREIAATLGALDDKIESNMRAAELIADLVREEFRAVSTHAEGLVLLSSLATFTKGVSYRSVDLRPSVTALVTLKSFLRTGGYTTEGLKPYAGVFKEAQQVLPGELAVAQTDLTQAAEVVGRVIRVPSDARYESLVASLDLVIVRGVDGVPTEFLYGLLQQPEFREHCRAHTSGTTVLHLAADALSTFVAPDIRPERRHAYAELVNPLLQQRDSLERESRILGNFRDTLLPELMSGRIRVAEAEQAVAEVV